MLSQIRDRKLAQWVIAYVVGAFVVLQGLELVTEAFPGFAIVLQVVLILALLGLPIVVVLAWFHGEKGRQRVSVVEAIILLAVVAGAGFAVFRFDVYGADSDPPGLEPITTTVDTSRYAVLPFRRDPGAPDALNEDTQIHDALARWQDIEMVGLVRLRDALEEGAGIPSEGPDQRHVAARVGAGRYVTGTVGVVGDRIRLHASLFDTRSGGRLADATVHVEPSSPLPRDIADEVAAALLFPHTGGAEEPDVTPATRSVLARRAFLSARRSLRSGNLVEADSLFAAALERDPGYARALVWRAQLAVWNGRDPGELESLVEAATAQRDRLPERERLMAEALLQLARDQYVESCRRYAALRDLDGRDFVAWYGLGECRAHDNVVVRDQDSPSGWAFRSSYHQAAEAYRRAFQLLPSEDVGISSTLLKRVGRNRLKISTTDVRRGRVLSADTLAMIARPAWMNDSLAFVPYRAADVASGRPEARPPTLWTAVERQRRLYNEIAESWVARFPRNPEALEALAHTQEFLGYTRALQTLDAARELTDDPVRRVMMTAEKVKLLVKFGSVEDYSRVPALADTVLSAEPPAGSEARETIAVVAALTGRVNLAARLVREAAQSFEWTVRLPAAVVGAAAALDAYAAMGAPADSMAASEALVDAALENRISPRDRDLARTMLLSRAASLAYPDHTLDSFFDVAERADYAVLEAQAAHARGDDARALEIMAGIRRTRQNLRRAEISFDAVYPEARLWAELGDTATAVVVLDGTLNTLRWSEPGSLTDVERAASLVRAMAFRAQLAAATDDALTAQRWAGAVAVLWRDADTPLQPLVRRMRRIHAAAEGADRRLSSPLDGGNR